MNRPITTSAGKAAGKLWVESPSVSLLLFSAFILTFILVGDVRRGLSWNEMAYYYIDYTIPVTLAVIAVLVSIGQKIWKFWESKPPAEFSKVKAKPGPLEILSAIWFFAIPSGPLFVWVLNAFDRTPSNWRLLLGISVIVTMILPLVCVLPWLRYVRGRAALLVLAFLAVGTALPLLTGLQSAIDFVRGPEWQTVSVRTFGADELDLLELSDGRTLRYPEKLYPALHSGGPQSFLVLRASRYILDAR